MPTTIKNPQAITWSEYLFKHVIACLNDTLIDRDVILIYHNCGDDWSVYKRSTGNRLSTFRNFSEALAYAQNYDNAAKLDT